VIYCAGCSTRSILQEVSMIFGLSVSNFTAFHVTLSLLGIASGLVALYEMTRGKMASTVTAIFLATTVLTSVTGFPIPPFGFDPPRLLGALSIVLLAAAACSLYVFKLGRHWRWIYIAAATTALYLNCFVGVVQTFQKVAFFNALAPTQTERPFAIAQGVLLLLFVAAGTLALRRFAPRRAATARLPTV
jgi:hypothetical protein